ncbi:HlyD family secretion protein [Flavobacterium sp.]|jgi:multidrug resistance efflux pump|uniref:HlyD family secretion protein n=1 Tax=Flavobacterium sp. TaxID=239 RepID=UPI00391DAE79
MEEKKDTTFELRSEEVQEILTQVPHWLIRWGSLTIFGVIILLVFTSWFIKYPDTISSKIVITTHIPPQKLMAKNTGRIEAILVKDKSILSENTPIAVIENSANYKDVFLLKSILDTFDIQKDPFPFSKLQSAQLGEIETSFAVFQKEYSVQKLNEKLQPFKVESSAQSLEAIQLKERLHLLESQKLIHQNELELNKTDYQRYQSLYNKGIIAAQELEKHKLILLSNEKSYKSLLSTISSLKSSINELKRTSKTTLINENKEQVSLERNLIQSYYALKKAIKEWELNYVFRSAIKGRVSYLQLWATNQIVNSGDQVFVIIPNKENGFVGKVKASTQNSGKINIGQKVIIRLANYPDREFGVLQGYVSSISLTPDKEGNILIDVSLPNGLKTSYKKQLQFQQEMVGTADIVTKDLRLSDRIFNRFKELTTIK